MGKNLWVNCTCIINDLWGSVYALGCVGKKGVFVVCLKCGQDKRGSINE